MSKKAEEPILNAQDDSGGPALKHSSIKVGVKARIIDMLLLPMLSFMMLIKECQSQTNTQAPNVVVVGPTRHVVPRTYSPGWYPMWDAHYTRNFYVASGADDISWGRERHTDNEDPDRSKRRVWIEAIQDHEGFSQDPTRNEVITCGIGGCEWYTIDPNSGPTTNHPNPGVANSNEIDGTAQNKTVFRHNQYWDWLGRTVANPGLNGAAINFGNPNTFRSDHVSTVAVIWYSSHFLCGGTADRGITRFDYRAGNNTYWLLNLGQTGIPGGGVSPTTFGNVANTNVSTDVTDLFVIWPTHWFVICRTRMNYQLADYTTMTSVTGNLFTRNDGNTNIDMTQTGGFGSYIDYRAGFSRVCISHDYTDMITCWDLTRGAGPITNTVIRKFRTGWPIRSLTGYYESPHFAVCGRKWIKVFNTWIDGVPAGDSATFFTNHVALYEEGVNYGGDTEGSVLANDFNRQIWDIIYINTRTYA